MHESMHRIGRCRSAAASACAVAAAGAWAGVPSYHFTPLDPSRNSYGTATAIDDDSSIAGESEFACITLWTKDGAGWSVAPAVSDCEFPGFVISNAISAGVVVGAGFAGSATMLAVTASDGALTVLPLGTFAQCNDINAAGVIVGDASFTRGFRLEAGEVSLLPENSSAQAVSSEGVIVGSDAGHAAIWHREDGDWVSMPLGIEAHESRANAINDAGDVVGEYRLEPNGPVRSFLWKNGTMTDLGTLGGPHALALGIAADGTVIGWSNYPSGAATAFLWRDGVMHDLNELVDGAFHLAYAVDINRQGQIVGWGGAPSQPFVVTPVIAGDLNLDATVDGDDVGTLLGAWGSGEADLDGDGTTDGSDLGILLGNWTN